MTEYKCSQCGKTSSSPEFCHGKVMSRIYELAKGMRHCNDCKTDYPFGQAHTCIK